jgi:hypothetical protein
MCSDVSVNFIVSTQEGIQRPWPISMIKLHFTILYNLLRSEWLGKLDLGRDNVL